MNFHIFTFKNMPLTQQMGQNYEIRQTHIHTDVLTCEYSPVFIIFYHFIFYFYFFNQWSERANLVRNVGTNTRETVSDLRFYYFKDSNVYNQPLLPSVAVVIFLRVTFKCAFEVMDVLLVSIIFRQHANGNALEWDQDEITK